ncbi:hypothetical protein EV702DRAFT_661252 [Suillus placidus]|uniref:Secreted protein n=1 Tax=Suillus placidus TaxID=48579 RepID=A0A9P6ZLX2_9AGAM|nr:hypothetical protein EV702DRAFT_661252 [Suillus placidus]
MAYGSMQVLASLAIMPSPAQCAVPKQSSRAMLLFAYLTFHRVTYQVSMLPSCHSFVHRLRMNTGRSSMSSLSCSYRWDFMANQYLLLDLVIRSMMTGILARALRLMFACMFRFCSCGTTCYCK